MSSDVLLAFEGIGKSFAGVPVLRQVSFAVGCGRTVGLVGENGAGKSTLMNILGGNLRADAGRLRLDGQPYLPARPADAARHGIAFVHQELNLFPNLTIAENLFLTRFPRVAGLPWIHRRSLHEGSAALLREVGLALPPQTPVERLSAGERQLVEIAKALNLEARLIILDEPTTSLSAREAEVLFTLLARLRTRGIALIYISHHLAEVLRLCDDLVVLRDGEVVGQGPRAGFDVNRLVALMVGRSLNQLYPTRSRWAATAAPADSPPTGDGERGAGFGGEENPPALEVCGVSQPGIVHDIRFTLRPGEVLGLSGLMGAGRSELARILFGLDPCERGTVRLAGRPLAPASLRSRIHQGLAFLTEDRRDEGLCLEASIADNIALVALRRHARGPVGLLNLRALGDDVRAMRESVGLTPTARDEAPVKTLSGGNQQKVVLAKWLLAQPRVLLLDEPTRGIDVGAKFEIYQLIHELADRGAGILVISSELEELSGICDRIRVRRRGEIVDELGRAEFDRERILKGALGA
jgi:ribose transport system ATP-binding protein